MNCSFLKAGRFWTGAFIALVLTGLLFAWQLNALSVFGFAGPPRHAVTGMDVIATMLISLLFSINVGLISWQKKYGNCPIGTKQATGLAAGVGVLALICPVCVLVPISIAGLSLSLAILSPFVPLLQIIAVILLLVSLFLLIPGKA